jgi:hypothetical protein
MPHTFNNQTTMALINHGNHLLYTSVLVTLRPVTCGTESDRASLHAQVDAVPQTFWRPGYLKRPQADKVPRFDPATFVPVDPTEEVYKNKRRQEIAAISAHMPQRVFASLKHRMIEHYQHLHGEIQCHSD